MPSAPKASFTPSNRPFSDVKGFDCVDGTNEEHVEIDDAATIIEAFMLCKILCFISVFVWIRGLRGSSTRTKIQCQAVRRRGEFCT